MTDVTSFVQKGNICAAPTRDPKSREKRLKKVNFALDPVDDEDIDKVDISCLRLENIRSALEDLVYSSCSHTIVGEQQFDVVESSSHFIGCINAIKNADETFLNMFESLLLLEKSYVITSLKTAELQVESDKERIESNDIDHHHTTDLDDDDMMTLPSLLMEQSRSMDAFNDVPMIAGIDAMKKESYPTGYGANDLIHDLKEWLYATRYRPQHEASTTAREEDCYQYGELITSQCHFVIVILYLLSINDNVKDIRLQRIGKKLRPLYASKKVITHDSTRVATHKMKKDGKLMNYYKEQLATGRYRITYTTSGHKITVDLAYLTSDDLVYVRHERSSSVYIRATKYICRTLFEGYCGDELVAVDTCSRADIGRLCYYHFQPLSVLKLPMLLLHQACKLLQSDIIFALQDHVFASHPMVERPRHSLQCITNIALVFVRNNCKVQNSEMIDHSLFDLFSDSTFQYV